ncbi:MAG: hypothetical protein AAFR87_27855 [Bacteroidota bacterium]
MKKLINFFKTVSNPKSGAYSILLGLMSFLAIIISLLTLQEMKTQRELSMMPILRIQNPDNFLLAVDSSCAESYFSRRISIKSDKKDSEAYSIDEDLFSLGLVNVGEGSAVNIEIDWDIDFTDIVEQFDALKIDTLKFMLKLENGNLIYRYQRCDEGFSGRSYSNLITTRKSHLLTASSQAEKESAKIPTIILEFLVNVFRAQWKKEGQNPENVFISKSLESHLNIAYESVIGNKFLDQYKITFSLTPPFFNAQTLPGGSQKVFASYQEFILEMKIEKI